MPKIPKRDQVGGSREQKELMEKWYEHTGFEFLRKDKVRASDPQGFINLWCHNVTWLRDVADEADAFLDEYRLKCG